MQPYVIETEGLSKSFGTINALQASLEANLVVVVWIIAFILVAYQRFEGEEL